MKNPARKKFEPMLSPYVDGELTPEERQQVEQHLAASKESANQVADFRAMSGLIRHSMDLAADEVDWKQFSNDVMAQLVPEKLPLLERLKLSLTEMFTWQRGPLFTGAALSAAAAIVLVAVLGQSSPVGYGAERAEVQTVSIDREAKYQPVVMETKGGDSIIWVVEEPDEKVDPRKTTGTEDNEELGLDPAHQQAEEKKAGEL